MAEIQLTRGKITTVDECDVEWLNQWKWQAHFDPTYRGDGNWLARRTLHGQGREGYSVYMHRVVLARMLERDLVRSEKVDHRDGNPLNNRRENIRLATHAQNVQNRKGLLGSSSPYKGVSWSKRSGCWIASIKGNGRRVDLGYFDNEHDAARAYDIAARQQYGEFAFLNFPDKEA